VASDEERKALDLTSLRTPSPILDVAILERNAKRIGEIAQSNGVQLRPHIKTHKCLEVASIQTRGQSGALTVSTLAEARAFATHGFDDLTYAVPIEPGKFAQVIELVRQGTKLSLITDDPNLPELLDKLARCEGIQLDVFLKVDCGYHRCGVEPKSREAFDIPRRITDSKNLRFAGILTHAGHSYNCKSKAELLDVTLQERDSMLELAAGLREVGIEVPKVSIGSTPTITHLDHCDGIDEIRPGNYIFFDAFQATLGSCKFDDCALTVLAAVIHRDWTHRTAVIDAGALALSKDRGPIDLNPKCGYGTVLDLEGKPLGVTLHSLSQEHGVLCELDDTTLELLKVGNRVRVVPNHSCLTAANHSHYNVLEEDRLVEQWAIHSGW
jgi:D-serine deaminase-like pyridoxal phosphate-dependent protein